jgi:methyl-accepting chemotaxis protein
LNDNIQSNRIKAQTLRSDAIRAEQSAEGFRTIGDSTRAETDKKNADKFNDEAARLERAADDAEREVQRLVKRAQDIEKQQEQIERESKRQLDDLEKEKRNLKGELTSLI